MDNSSLPTSFTSKSSVLLTHSKLLLNCISQGGPSQSTMVFVQFRMSLCCTPLVAQKLQRSVWKASREVLQSLYPWLNACPTLPRPFLRCLQHVFKVSSVRAFTAFPGNLVLHLIIVIIRIAFHRTLFSPLQFNAITYCWVLHEPEQ